ncbi:hypothetical protein FM038_009250 [Shewanella eurypsychrophilus]|uniref:Uncharacterized protein n=1 Tax=Shewanella eurypsychrophilus TaxID=2593656 RepID=A0ABX6V4P7_9GAMM|nr:MULTISPECIES: hypothetical protein [Shewanella]QFU22326.1 hypothetical protein FS418_10830 [Shewanella sp. YLB-09]QPG57612.1 hypothetical protein FM038_009250 [Shewanella eurypsychrophilus]
MKQRFSAALTSVSTLLIAPTALAHPGHDHAHWSSSMVHLLWILPTVAALGLAITMYRRKKAATQSDNK